MLIRGEINLVDIYCYNDGGNINSFLNLHEQNEAYSDDGGSE